MAVSSSALTLAQWAFQSNDPLVNAITFSLYESGSVLQDIPFVNRKTMTINGSRWTGALPTINWSKINVDPVVTSGTPAAYQEQAFIVRNAIDVDKVLVEDENNIIDPRQAQVQAWMRGYAYDVNDKFINNTHATGNVDAIVGVRSRLDNPTDWGIPTTTKIDAGGVNLSDGNITAANANSFIMKVQSLLDSMGAFEGDGVTLYMNADMRRRFEAAVRVLGAGGGWDMTRDAYGRSVALYRNAKVRYIGRKADQTTEIITSTETAAGVNGASTFTSIYAVKYGLNDVFGWQFEPLSAKDIGLIGNGGSTYRTVIDHVYGLVEANVYSIGRLYDIKVA